MKMDNPLFPIVDFKAPKKRIYHDYMWCQECRLMYNKSDFYKPRYCTQCGKLLVKKRKLAAIWDNYENLQNGCYRLLYTNISGKQIEKIFDEE